MSSHLTRAARANSQRRLSQTTYDRSVLYRNQAPMRPTPQATQTSKRIKLRMILVALLLLAIGSHGLWTKHAAAETVAAQQAHQAAVAEAKQKTATFASQMNALITMNPQDTLSIATATDADGVRTYGSNDAFDGASTGKLLTAIDYLHHVEQGTASLNQKIDGQSAQYLLKIMIINSDDTAWETLNNYLSHEDLSDYAGNIGFNNYDPWTNSFTASDVAMLLQQLYDGKLVNASHRSLLLSYLARANYRGYVVAAVPSNDTVYHKIGIDEDTVNDATIIKSDDHYVVLVIFTDGHGTYNWNARAQLMQMIAKDAMAAYL